jgi:hypothetical protein
VPLSIFRGLKRPGQAISEDSHFVLLDFATILKYLPVYFKSLSKNPRGVEKNVSQLGPIENLWVNLKSKVYSAFDGIDQK